MNQSKRTHDGMLDVNDETKRDAVFSIGRVVEVEGRRVCVSVDKLKNSGHLLYKGGIVRNVSVGSQVKIVKGFVELVAVVDGEHVKEDVSVQRGYSRNVDNLIRELDVSLIGYFDQGTFYRGVREMPLLGNECFILSENEYRAVHTFVKAGAPSITIGNLAMEPTQPINIGVDGIFASHIGIFGNTGSGKSYTLTALYHELFERFGSLPGFVQRSHFILIDFNGEYVDRKLKDDDGDRESTSVITDNRFKQEYKLTTKNDSSDRLPMPKTAVYDPVFWTILLDATAKTQAPFIARVLQSDYWDKLISEPNDLMTVIANLFIDATHNSDPSLDHKLPLQFLEQVSICLGSDISNDFVGLVDNIRHHLNFRGGSANSFYWNATNQYADTSNDSWDDTMHGLFQNVDQSFASITDVDLIRFKLVMQFYRDIISGFANQEHIGPLIKRLDERIDGIKRVITISEERLLSKPLTVISLRNVNLDMRKILPMILCRHLYENKKMTDPDGETYLNIIIDEAHNILSMDSARESETWRDYRLETFEEIIKEGRKFGTFLTIASQRPHDISPTIISQLHNYFLHRLVNDLDVKAVEKAVSYLDRVSFESLPILPTGTCLLSGVAAQLPVLMSVNQLDAEYEPNSRTIPLSKNWDSPIHPVTPTNQVLDS
jgi:hypothetical protein